MGRFARRLLSDFSSVRVTRNLLPQLQDKQAGGMVRSACFQWWAVLVAQYKPSTG